MSGKLAEMLGVSVDTIPIDVYVDARSVVDTSSTTHVPREKRLLVELAIVRQALEAKEIRKLGWVAISSRVSTHGMCSGTVVRAGGTPRR